MIRQQALIGEDYKSDPKEARGSDRPSLRVAIIGFGISGRVFHAPLIQANDSFVLEAIVTSDPGRADAARASYPHAQVIHTPEQLFARVDEGELTLDVVVIGTPPLNHKQLAKAALERGLHVVIDNRSSRAPKMVKSLLPRRLTPAGA